MSLETIRSVVWKEGRKCGLVPAGDLTLGLVCRADLRINMNKKGDFLTED